MSRSEASKLRIILAAESLIARHGLGDVSAREVAKAAGLRNNVSVQYHFGSMDGLLVAIKRYRMEQLEIGRASLLEQAEKCGKLKDVHSLLGALCLPHIGITDEDGRHPYAAFMVQYVPRYQPAGFTEILQDAHAALPVLDRLISLFAESLPQLPREVLIRRMSGAVLHFLNALIAHDVEEGLNAHQANAAIVLQDCLSQSAAAICVPYAPEISPDLEWIVSGAQ